MSRINVGKVSPIPKGNWVQTNSYEKLNMVNKSGVLYIAKQDVPANTAITNENYWMKATSSLSIGTVNTVAYDTPASATITEGENSPILNLNLPRGASGGEIIDDSAQSTDRVWSANKVNNTLSTKATSIVESDSGAMVTIEDGAEAPVKSLTVGIEPVQDLHGYDAPWPAGGGKNLFVPNIQSGSKTNYSYTVNDDGTITVTVTAADANNILDIGTFHAAANVSYTISGCPAGGSLAGNRLYYAGAPVSAYDKGSGASFTLEEDSDLTVRLGCGVVGTFTFKPMICLVSASEPTSFAPYANICPISGHTQAVVTRTGKNLFDVSATSTENGFVENKYVNSSGILVPNTDCNVSEYISAKPNAQYVINPVSGSNVSVAFYDSNKTFISATNYGITWGTYGSKTFTTPANVKFIRLSIIKIKQNETQLELGSTATPYETYSGQTISVTFPSEAGTVYGGYVDVTNRVLTVDRAGHVFDGTENITNANNRLNYITDSSLKPINVNYEKHAISSFYPSRSPNEIWSNRDTSGYIGVSCAQGGGNGYIYLLDNANFATKDVTTYKAWLASQYSAGTPLIVVYNLATPLTYTLTESEISDILSTLYGTNHIWSDTGDVTLEYRADTKLYIDTAIAKSQQATRALIAGIEASMTATQNYTTGALIIVGDDLYKATANIASGGMLTVGTNVAKITLAQYILEQLSA